MLHNTLTFIPFIVLMHSHTYMEMTSLFFYKDKYENKK